MHMCMCHVAQVMFQIFPNEILKPHNYMLHSNKANAHCATHIASHVVKTQNGELLSEFI